MESSGFSLSDSDRISLLKLARSTMRAKLAREPLPDPEDVSASFNITASCFVSLHSADGNLRGCIGNIGGFEPLALNVVHNAVNAAFGDPRFRPVSTEGELASLEIEISVLSSPAEIASYDEFIVGEHGIILRKDRYSAVFLPQVAPEQGWDRETTLTHLAIKAGLPPDAWRDTDTVFSVFTATVFSEKDFPGECN